MMDPMKVISIIRVIMNLSISNVPMQKNPKTPINANIESTASRKGRTLVYSVLKIKISISMIMNE